MVSGCGLTLLYLGVVFNVNVYAIIMIIIIIMFCGNFIYQVTQINSLQMLALLLLPLPLVARRLSDPCVCGDQKRLRCFGRLPV